MDREFETFRAGANEPIANRMHVTISPAKLILLNRNLFNKLGKPEAVSLSYSRKRDIIAVKPISPRLNEAFPVAPTGMSYRINATPVLPPFQHQDRPNPPLRRSRHRRRRHPPPRPNPNSLRSPHPPPEEVKASLYSIVEE